VRIDGMRAAGRACCVAGDIYQKTNGILGILRECTFSTKVHGLHQVLQQHLAVPSVHPQYDAAIDQRVTYNGDHFDDASPRSAQSINDLVSSSVTVNGYPEYFSV
jgi:hypothetical protein